MQAKTSQKNVPCTTNISMENFTVPIYEYQFTANKRHYFPCTSTNLKSKNTYFHVTSIPQIHQKIYIKNSMLLTSPNFTTKKPMANRNYIPQLLCKKERKLTSKTQKISLHVHISSMVDTNWKFEVHFEIKMFFIVSISSFSSIRATNNFSRKFKIAHIWKFKMRFDENKKLFKCQVGTR